MGPEENITQYNTLYGNFHGGPGGNYFLLPQDMRIITYQPVGSSSMASTYSKILQKDNAFDPLIFRPTRGTISFPPGDTVYKKEVVRGIEYIKPEAPHIWKPSVDNRRVYMMNYTINATFFMDADIKEQDRTQKNIDEFSVNRHGFKLCNTQNPILSPNREGKWDTITDLRYKPQDTISIGDEVKIIEKDNYFITEPLVISKINTDGTIEIKSKTGEDFQGYNKHMGRIVTTSQLVLQKEDIINLTKQNLFMNPVMPEFHYTKLHPTLGSLNKIKINKKKKINIVI